MRNFDDRSFLGDHLRVQQWGQAPRCAPRSVYTTLSPGAPPISARRSVFNLEFSPSGHILVAVCEDSSVQVLDPLANRVRQRLHAHSSCVNVARFNGEYIVATGSDDCMIKIWDLRKLQCVKTLHGHRGWVKNIEFLDERTVLSSAFDGTIRAWDLRKEYPSSTTLSFDPGGAGLEWIAADEQANVLLKHRRLRRMRLSPDRCTLIVAVDRSVCLFHNLRLSSFARDVGGALSEAVSSSHAPSDVATAAQADTGLSDTTDSSDQEEGWGECEVQTVRTRARARHGSGATGGACADERVADAGVPWNASAYWPLLRCCPFPTGLHTAEAAAAAAGTEAAFAAAAAAGEGAAADARETPAAHRAFLRLQSQYESAYPLDFEAVGAPPASLATAASAVGESASSGSSEDGETDRGRLAATRSAARTVLRGVGEAEEVVVGDDDDDGSEDEEESEGDRYRVSEEDESDAESGPLQRAVAAAAQASTGARGVLAAPFAPVYSGRPQLGGGGGGGGSGAGSSGGGGRSVSRLAQAAVREQDRREARAWDERGGCGDVEDAAEAVYLPRICFAARNRLEVLREPGTGMTLSLQVDSSGQYLLTRRVMEEWGGIPYDTDVTCVYDLGAPSLLPSGAPASGGDAAEVPARAQELVDARPLSLDPENVFPDRLMAMATDSDAAPDYIKGPCFSGCGNVVASPYYNGIRLFDFARVRAAAPSDPMLAHLTRRRRGGGPHGQRHGSTLPLLHHLINTHAMPALTCRFHPHLPMLASGGLDGCVQMYSPVF